MKKKFNFLFITLLLTSVLLGLAYISVPFLLWGQELTTESIRYQGRDYRVTPYTDKEKNFLLGEELKRIDKKLADTEREPNTEVQRILSYLKAEIEIKGRHEKIVKVQTDLIKKIEENPSWWISERIKRLEENKALVQAHLASVKEAIDEKVISIK